AYPRLGGVPGETPPLAAARCALAVDLKVGGCSRGVPAVIRLPFNRARELVKAFAADPSRPRLLKQALGGLAAAHRAAQRLAKHDQCGDALGLVVSYTQGVVGAARSAATG